MDMKWRDQNWLREHYITQEKSMPAMAKEAKCSHVTIGNWLHRYKIPIRNCGEGCHLAMRNFVGITPDLLEFLEGEIQGDGHVGMHGNYSALYSHGSKYREYVIWLSGRFNAWGIKQSGQITRREHEESGAISYHYNSRSYPELVPIRKKWYSKRGEKMKKTVSEGFKLTPIRARQWYLGDGGLEPHKPYRPSIKLGTYDFDKESVEYLVEELCNLGFKATRHADNTIYLWVRSVQDFLNWIGPCPISCYDYKWDYDKSLKTERNNVNSSLVNT